jgi:hypothetical protein
MRKRSDLKEHLDEPVLYTAIGAKHGGRIR